MPAEQQRYGAIPVPAEQCRQCGVGAGDGGRVKGGGKKRGGKKRGGEREVGDETREIY